jgi:hypothetical protein
MKQLLLITLIAAGAFTANAAYVYQCEGVGVTPPPKVTIKYLDGVRSAGNVFRINISGWEFNGSTRVETNMAKGGHLVQGCMKILRGSRQMKAFLTLNIPDNFFGQSEFQAGIRAEYPNDHYSFLTVNCKGVRD